MIQQSLENALRRAGLDRERRDGDHAGAGATPTIRRCADPTKFIGHGTVAERARGAAARRARGEEGRRAATLRRVVGQPGAAGDSRAARDPAARRARGRSSSRAAAAARRSTTTATRGWEGIDAVVDKDLAAAVLARDLGATLLLILTDVDAVYADWGTPQQRPLAHADGRRSGRDGSREARSARAAWRRRFARRSTSCAAPAGARSLRSSSRGREAVRGEAGTTITAENGVNIHEYQAKEILRARRRADSAGRGRDDARRGRGDRAASSAARSS